MLAGMKNTSLSRSIPYWLLSAISVAVALIGGWLVLDNTSTMQRTLLDGTATNVEVYVGQAWITAGGAILAAGIIGILLTLALAALKALVPSTTETLPTAAETTAFDDAPLQEETPEVQEATELENSDQNGSSGSTATATKINVK
jgi:ABC-type Na+ efflux pump permease subunit